MQVIRCHSKPTESKTLEVESQPLCFMLQVVLMKTKFYVVGLLVDLLCLVQ